MAADPIQLFGQVIQELRTAQGLSQQRLADESNLDRAFVSQVENGRKQPSLLTIFQLAAGLKVSPSLLLTRTETRLPSDWMDQLTGQ